MCLSSACQRGLQRETGGLEGLAALLRQDTGEQDWQGPGLGCRGQSGVGGCTPTPKGPGVVSCSQWGR